MAEKEKQEKDYIVIEVNGQELRFDRDLALQHYDSFINTGAAGKLAKAANNYCVSVIHKEDLVAFRELRKKNPATSLAIAVEVSDSAAPEVEITVKKR